MCQYQFGESALIGADKRRVNIARTDGRSSPARTTSPIAALALGRVDTLDWKGPDDFHQNAVVTYPPEFDARKKYPVILFIHSGPHSASFTTFSSAAGAVPSPARRSPTSPTSTTSAMGTWVGANSSAVHHGRWRREAHA